MSDIHQLDHELHNVILRGSIVFSLLQRIQEMEERRVGRVRESMRVYTEVERKVLPIVSKCLDGMTKAAESIEPKMVR